MLPYLLIAALFAVAIAVQVVYVRANAEQATGTTRLITSVNIGLLSLLALGALILGFLQEVR